MMRKDIEHIVNDLSIKWCRENNMIGFDVLECARLIHAYCKETKTQPRKHEYQINNGVLAIDGNMIDRVAPRTKGFNIAVETAESLELSLYWEGKCLDMNDVDL